MKTAAERMRDELNATGCYALDGTTPGDWDLLAMAQAVADLDNELEQLVQDVFLNDCTDDTLTQWEQCIRPQRSTAAAERRKEMLRSRLAIHPHGSSIQACSALLPAAGVYGSLTESESGLTVNLAGIDGIPEEKALQELSTLLPAHLTYQITPVVTWQTLELADRTFEAWDDLSLTWNELDALTQAELKGE